MQWKNPKEWIWKKEEEKKRKEEEEKQGDDQWIFAQNVMKGNLRHFSSFCQMPWYTTICHFPVCTEYIFATVWEQY